MALHKHKREQLLSLIRKCERALEEILEPPMVWQAFVTGDMNENARAYMDLIPIYKEQPIYKGERLDSPTAILVFKPAFQKELS